MRDQRRGLGEDSFGRDLFFGGDSVGIRLVEDSVEDSAGRIGRRGSHETSDWKRQNETT